MNAPFLDIPNHYVYFLNRPELDLRVIGIGYNDFNSLKGYYHYRSQSFYTIHFVISGKGTLVYEGKTYHVGAGDIFALPPNKLFCYFPDSNEPWEYIFVEFVGTLASEYLTSIGFSSSLAVKTCNNSKKLLSACKDCLVKSKNKEKVSHFEAEIAILQFFASCTDNEYSVLKTDENVIRRVKEFIDTHFTNPNITVEEIANAVHFSHSRLCHLFRERTGQTMISYLNECRMRRAEEMLLSMDISANKIAQASGFSEYTYFLMLFKRKHGITTSQFRSKR